MRYLLTLSALFISLFSFAQLPSGLGIGFQGYARKADGSAISNQAIRVQFSIYDKEGGQQVSQAPFVELHNVESDAYGVFTAEVGSINTADFIALDFTNTKYALNVQVGVSGGDLVQISDKPFNVVPYAQAAGNGVPAGTIMAFGGNNTEVPVGWEVCDGGLRDPNSNKYKALYAAIGNNWGTENGQFRLPNLLGRFLRGFSGGSNVDPDKNARTALYAGGSTGNKVGTYQVGDIQSHNHTLNDPGHNHNSQRDGVVYDRLLSVTNRGTIVQSDNDTNPDAPDLTLSNGTNWVSTGITIQPSGGNETRPVNASVLYIIKL